MRNRPRKEDPISRQSVINYERKRISRSAKLFEKHRDIENFLTSLKKQLELRNISIAKLQAELGMNKKVVYSWLAGKSIPSQKYQIMVCEHLNIPYSKLALTANKDGDYPCGIRACTHCGSEFALFKKSNYGRMKCENCKTLDTKFDYACIQTEWVHTELSLSQLVSLLESRTGKLATRGAIRSHFKKLNLVRNKSKNL